jgi:hypothetical protein
VSEEVILAVIPLPQDLATVGKLLKAINKAFPKAMCRDAEHSGIYFEAGVGGDPSLRWKLEHRHQTMEVILP